MHDATGYDCGNDAGPIGCRWVDDDQVGALAAGALLAPGSWTPPTTLDLVLLGLLGAVAVLAHLCITRALKLADAALVAPLQYTLLPWAIVLGWPIFGDAPRPAMLLGGGIIIAAGLAVYLGERARGEP